MVGSAERSPKLESDFCREYKESQGKIELETKFSEEATKERVQRYKKVVLTVSRITRIPGEYETRMQGCDRKGGIRKI